jgi:hypothetical protein
MTTQTDESTDGGPPNAPGYREFRMAAAWASAIRGVPLHLEYEPTTGRMQFAGGLTVAPPLMTPPNAPLRAAVQQVEMAFPGADAPLRLGGDLYSALLWSESAVEKFLFPYYASAEADNAARFMARVSNAWYGYPGRVVQVCALAVRYGTVAGGGELSLDATVDLVCVERAKRTLAVMSLSAFEKTYPSGAARGAAPAGTPGEAVRCDGYAWAVGANEVDSIVAREAAEFVSGLRGRYVWFTLDGGKLTPWICPTEQPGAAPPEGRVFASGVATPVRGDRPPPSWVTLRVEGRTDHTIVRPGADPTKVPDSIFWSDGAVEKLVLPYYASVKGRDAPFFTCVLMGKWDGLIGAGCCDSECALTALRGLIPGEGRPAGDPITAPFAVTHLPRSEYVSDAGGGFSPALEHRTRLLAVGPDGIEEHPLYGAPAPRPAG